MGEGPHRQAWRWTGCFSWMRNFRAPLFAEPSGDSSPADCLTSGGDHGIGAGLARLRQESVAGGKANYLNCCGISLGRQESPSQPSGAVGLERRGRQVGGASLSAAESELLRSEIANTVARPEDIDEGGAICPSSRNEVALRISATSAISCSRGGSELSS
jgi:hypothetical protein